MNKNLSIRNSKNAKKGLIKMCEYIKNTSLIPLEVGIEIGSFSGDSAKIFSEQFEKIYCVDQWESNYDPTGIDQASNPDIFDMKEVEEYFNLLCLERTNIIKIKKSSEDAYKDFDNSFFDFVYLDANHNYDNIYYDIQIWLPKVKKGGFICGHDYQKRFPGVIKAVLELLGEPDQTFKDSSWIKRIL